MNHADIAALMEGIAPVMRGFVEKTFAPLALRLAEIEKRMDADAPVLIELQREVGKIGPRLERHVVDAIGALPKPEAFDVTAIERSMNERCAKIERRFDELPEVASLVAIAVDKATASLPEYVEGAVKALAEALPKTPTAAEVAALVPPAEPGKRVAIEEVQPLVDEAVAAAMAQIPVPKDGESVDPAAVKTMVDEAVSALPGPKEVDREELAGLVVAEVGKAMASLPPAPTAEDVAALIPPPEPGKSVSIDDVRTYLDDAVAGAFATMRVPEDGDDADPKIIEAMVDEAVKALPPAEPGKNVTDEQIIAAVEKVLATWERPKDGDSVTVEQLQPAIEVTVEKAMAARPVPKNGNDGIGLAGAIKDHEGCLVLTLTDGAVVKLGKVDGEKGKPGVDGLGFDDLDVARDGERGFKFVFRRGEQVKEFAFSLPVVIDRGVFKDGAEYVDGDGVTFGGSFWIAQGLTKDKPGTSDAWRLAVKKGRDGKDGELPKPPPTVKLK